MRIASIEDRDKRKATVTLEDGPSFALYRRELAQYRIKEEAELDAPALAEIMELLRRRAMQRCGALLKDRDYTESALCRKLRGDGHAEETIRTVTEALKEAGYLNDLRFAENYIRCHLADKSRMRICRDLSVRGVSGETAEQAFGNVLSTEGGEAALREREAEQIRRLLAKRGYDPGRADWKEKQKTMAFLYRRGFSQELIRHAVGGEDE